MSVLVVEAVYESGVLKPAQSLPLSEHEKVQLTIQRPPSVDEALQVVRRTAGLIPCRDAQLIERIALEPIDEL